ncbi:MAG: hypothetical protein IPK79_12905 [Vampirovibrionales bacterium]|nr:hypothetical protein [Vampirovibrionales bacterium]
MQFDGTLILVLLSFVGFMLAMRTIYFEPIRRIKAEREALLRHEQQEAAAFAAQCERLQAELEARLRQARQEAQQRIQAKRQSAKDSARGMMASARESARQTLDAQLEELSRWQAQTYEELGVERRHLATLALERITRRPAVAAASS